MITKTDLRGVQNGKELVRLAFKSTDSKPTTGIMNGSTGIEVNTGKQYVYDEESGEWTEIASSGGGGGGSWTVLTEESVTTSAQGGSYKAKLLYLEPIHANTIRVTFNGTEYECERQVMGDFFIYGASVDAQTGVVDWSEYPFCITSNSGNYPPNEIFTETAGTYTLKIEEEQSGGGSSYDLIITADNALIDSATSFTLTEGSVTDAYNKIIAGEYVKVLIIGDGSGTPPQEMAIYESWRVMTTSTEGNLEVAYFNYNNNGTNYLAIDENGNVSMA